METGLIFDMDGVIIDSNPYHRIVWGEFFRDKEVHFDDRVFENSISGRPAASTIRNFLGPHLSEEAVSKYLDEVDGAWAEILSNTEGIEPLPGLKDFLDSARTNGYQTALATSATTRIVDLVLERLNLPDYFGIIVDKAEVTHGKPHPEVYLKTLERLVIPKDRCVVFEDSKAGIRSARDAGIRVVGVASGHTPEELWNEGVDKVIEDFTELDLDDIMKLLN